MSQVASTLSRLTIGGQGNLPPQPANDDEDMVRLNVTFSAQNCNSLNVSGLAKNTRAKVTSILNLNADIIFLSDVRLGNKAKYVSDLFRLKYRFHHNSTQNRRGVAVLVRNELDFVLTDTILDQDENVIFIAGSCSGTKLLVGSVYGPNENNKGFFQFIENTLIRFKDYRVAWAVTGTLLCPPHQWGRIRMFLTCVQFQV